MVRQTALCLVLVALSIGCGVEQTSSGPDRELQRGVVGTSGQAQTGDARIVPTPASAGETKAVPTPVSAGVTKVVSSPASVTEAKVATTPAPEPTPRTGERKSGFHILHYFPETSLRERIVLADVIARVRFHSVRQLVEAIPSISDTSSTSYVSALEYRFSVVEYLKGSGAVEIVGIAIDTLNLYETREEAEASNDDFVSGRDTRWDDREAVVFFKKSLVRIRPHSTSKEGRYQIGVLRSSLPDLDGSDLDTYTIGSRLNKGWLPTKIHRLTCREGVWGPCSPYSECDGRVKRVTSCGIEPPEPGLMGHDGVLAPFETALGPRWTWHARATVLSRL